MLWYVLTKVKVKSLYGVFYKKTMIDRIHVGNIIGKTNYVFLKAEFDYELL